MFAGGILREGEQRMASDEATTRRSWPGLTSAEAQARLKADGPNALPTSEKRNLLRVLGDVVREPMFLLLFGAAGLYLLLGDVQEALVLLGFVCVTVTITVVQEGRTERALDALRDLSSPRAQVLRDGAVVTIPGRDLVRGDIIRVAEGDRVPGDALLRSGTVLNVDESLLTGESVAVTKTPAPDAEKLTAPGGDGSSSLFSGTLVVSGRGLAEVLATGARSELGRIGTSLKEVERGRTPLQKEVDVVVRRLAILGVSLSVLLFLIRGLSDGDWLGGALAGITLAMSLLPEEFPVIMTVFLALGAWRIAKSRVLTRRVTAVETLGGVHVICTDKTGTLTQNRMTIRRLLTDDADITVTGTGPLTLPENGHALVEFGILASPRDPFDPMEKAFWELGHRALETTEHLHPAWAETREYPLSPKLLAVTHVWTTPERSSLVVATKGAPEAVFDLCHLPEAQQLVWRERVQELALEGLRVLAVARHRGTVNESPTEPHDIDFEMVGLVGLEDPLREDVAIAVAMCRRAHIRVVMITGDHPETARAIAKKAGIDTGDVVAGPELEGLSDEALEARLANACVIARAVPSLKLRIVRAFQHSGLRVGMTGDGVNDAPALKAADIGIAMGARGTEVAREAASLVLVEDDFGSIVQAVRIGRRIYDNLRKAVNYVIAVHIPIAGLSLVPALMHWGAILAPAHVVFLELIIDPACSIVFEMEPEEPDVMDRHPRSNDTHLFGGTRVLWAVMQGTLVLLATLGLLAFTRRQGLDAEAQRTLGFVSLVFGNLAILLASRSLGRPFWVALRRRNGTAILLMTGTIVLLATIIAVPFLRQLFGFALVAPLDLLRAVGIGALPVLVLDVFKLFRRSPPEA
jgi:Ca2+-transporting ATPase